MGTPTTNYVRSTTSNEFGRLQEWVKRNYKDGREKSLAITKLQEAGMWLEKAELLGAGRVNKEGESNGI